MINLKNLLNQNKNRQKRKENINFLKCKEISELSQKRINGFQRKILRTRKQTQEKGIKILTPKQMLQRLPTALAIINAGNTSENLLHEIQQIKCTELCMDLCNKEKKLLKKYIIILSIQYCYSKK